MNIEPDTMYTTKELSDYLGISQSVLSKKIRRGVIEGKKGEIRTVTYTRGYLIKGQDFINYLEKFNEPSTLQKTVK